MDPSGDGLTSAAKLVELLLVFGGVIAFGWWQLRDVSRAREQTRIRQAAERARQRDIPGTGADAGQPDTSHRDGSPPPDASADSATPAGSRDPRGRR